MNAASSLRYVYILALFSISNVRGGRVLLGLYALDLGAPPVMIGVLAATFSAMPALLAWQVGKWADRYGSRWPLMFGTLGAALGILVPFFFHNMTALFIAAVFNGIAFAFVNVTQQNAVGILGAPERRTQNFANLTLMMSMGNFVGPLVAGFSIDHLGGPANACLAIMSLALVATAMLIVGGAVLPKGVGKEKAGGGSLMDLLRDRTMLKILMIGGLVLAAIDIFAFYVPIYTHGLGLSASAIGMILAAFAAAAFISRIFLSWMLSRATVEQVLARCFFLSAAAFVVFPFFENAIVLGVLAFLFGAGVSLGQPITMMLSFGNSPSGRSGETMGLRQTVNHGTRVIAPLVFGAIGSAFGMLSVFILNSLMLLSGGMVVGGRRIESKDGKQDAGS